MRHFMLLPSMACPASCTYCFGPNSATQPMPVENMAEQVVEAAAGWIQSVAGQENISITFHGGEPLNARPAFFRTALPRLGQTQLGRQVELGLQSNLWLLNDEFCELFQEYQVGLGTSLDGPEDINDAQRGRGYFRKTMAGLALARKHHLSAGVIATLTAQSAGRWREVLDFFRFQGLNVSFHAALAALLTGEAHIDANPAWALSPEAYADVLLEMLEVLAAPGQAAVNRPIRVEPIASACKSIHQAGAGTCTFNRCLGKFYAVVPDGSIYPCQRFAGITAFRLGNVLDRGGQPEVENSAAWEMLARREENIAQACAGCDFLTLCYGGCVYNALAAGRGSFANGYRDPYCKAYTRLFNGVIERAMGEFFSPENLELVVEQPDERLGLLRHGAILRMMAGVGRGS